MLKLFGNSEDRKVLESSPNYRNGAFHNLADTPMLAPGTNYLKIMRDFFSAVQDREPKSEFRFDKTDLKSLPENEDSLVWFGHSSYFLSLHGFRLLVDPVLSGHASPFSFMVKSFRGTDLYDADDFPEIDLLLITHDHYDHLDYHFIKRIASKIKKVVCSLGVGAHLRHWGYKAEIITELDWWQQAGLGRYSITAVPARHFSGRLFSRNQSLWSAFVLQRADLRILLGGDSGYGEHFRTIGVRCGPFDLAILECGQYNQSWPLIHMMPEETVQAAMDLNAKILFPVHWAKFSLALHSWYEPADRVYAAAGARSQEIATPQPGQRYDIGKTKTNTWWSNFK